MIGRHMRYLLLLVFAFEIGGQKRNETDKEILPYMIGRLPCWQELRGVCVKLTSASPFIDPTTKNDSTETKRLCGSEGKKCVIPPGRHDQYKRRNEQCGIRKEPDNFRIFGGYRSYLGEWPWHVYINQCGCYHCGGVLIHERWILSAAHCFALFHYSEEQYDIVTGSIDLITHLKTEQRREVKKIHNHPAFHTGSGRNDIALLELDEDVSWSEHIAPICLPEVNETFHNMICTATGFGLTERGGLSRHLLQVQKPIVDTVKCQKQLCRHGLQIYPTTLCAGFEDGERDACNADSGGPFVCEKYDKSRKKRWVLGGVVSFGQGCGQPKTPGVYTNVAPYLEWIESVTKLPVFDGSYTKNPDKKFVHHQQGKVHQC